MMVNKRDCKVIAVRPQPEVYSELKKEAEGKGLTVARYCEEIVNNRNNLVNNQDNDEKLYRVTVEEYLKKPIKDIKKEFEERKNLFDGEYGYINLKLISIEEVK